MPKKFSEEKRDKKGVAAKSKNARVSHAKGARRRERASERPRGYNTRTVAPPATQGLSITVQLPPLRRPRPRAGGSSIPVSHQKSLFSRLWQPKVLIPFSLIVLTVITLNLPAHKPKPSASARQTATRTAPDFKPLQPSAEKASATKYDGTRNLVTYTTNFSGSRITVSQQPLPANFVKDKEAIIKAADTIHAKLRVDTVKGPLYIASNDKGNDQLALFASPTVLLFIHTDRMLDEASWKSFVELLEVKS